LRHTDWSFASRAYAAPIRNFRSTFFTINNCNPPGQPPRKLTAEDSLCNENQKAFCGTGILLVPILEGPAISEAQTEIQTEYNARPASIERWERQSPDWRFPPRHSGEWRSQETFPENFPRIPAE
jgi:hypothetical protein